MPTTDDRLQTAIRAAMRAGEALMARRGTPLPVQRKESARDVASLADLEAERAAFAVLREADADTPILAEEHGRLGTTADETRGLWVVDALDGSVNFLQQLPLFCVSVAWVCGGKPAVGVVYAPQFDDLWFAASGLGAFRNQQRLRVPDPAPEDALLAASFSGRARDPARRDEEFALFARINDASRGCLRTGSAALNLAWLADGRLHGCWGKCNKSWDLMAGLVIAREAGASVWTADDPLQPGLLSYAAASPAVHDWLLPQALPVIRPMAAQTPQPADAVHAQPA